ncbi:MAG: iron-sulfur cluster loop [Desulfurococcaceae archaeon]
MDIIGIDILLVDRVARTLKRKGLELQTIDIYDTRFYPPRDEDLESSLRYFFVMVSMDHRLSRPGRKYRACIEDGCYEGADLLYRLGMKKYLEDTVFFSPEKMSSISIDEVKKVFSVGDVAPPDPEIRAYLLRDLGTKLAKIYNSRVINILNSSNNRIRGSIHQPGLVDNLRIFRAYEDPVEKKSMLLAKFLIAREYFKPIDTLDVAVDNHLSRVAYRLGLVMVSGTLWEKIKKGFEVSHEEDILLRLFVKRAYRLVCEISGSSPLVIDDFIWTMGRKTCLRDSEPLCDKCLFKGFCKARKNLAFMVSEHVYYNTWYY